MLPKFLRTLMSGAGHLEELKIAMTNKDGEPVEKIIRSAFQNEKAGEIQPLMASLCV